MAGTSIGPVDAPKLLAPLLPAIPPATVSTEPPVALLPLLSPVLRQRVQVFAASSTDPWLRWLCYDTGRAAQLGDVARSGALEPHPVSGEVEVDWDYDVETRYRRADQETMQAMVALKELGIAFQLVYCVNDPEGGGAGWRVGEITTTDGPSPFSHFGGASSITEAERHFKEGQSGQDKIGDTGLQATSAGKGQETAEEEDDDDDYWARYDATPARTPAHHKSPAPGTGPMGGGAAAEEDYFAQYDDVQPAMDNHDPDEEAAAEHVSPPLGVQQPAPRRLRPATQDETSRGQAFAESALAALGKLDDPSHSHGGGGGTEDSARVAAALVHPRPDSSASSNGSHTVAKLEATAGKQEQNEFGVKQHISRSIRSLFMLGTASGIDRAEFEQLVRTELDVLRMMEQQEL